MSNEETPVHVSVEKEKGASRAQQILDWLRGRKPSSKLDSDRFERLGYLPYPMRTQLDDRVYTLANILAEITATYETAYTEQQTIIAKLDRAKTKDEKEVIREELTDFEDIKMRIVKQKTINKLDRAFMLMASPYFKGIDKPRLMKKFLMYKKLVSQLGDIPELWRVLDYCTSSLIGFGWATEDVTPETPVLFETRTVIQPTKDKGFDMKDAKEQ